MPWIFQVNKLETQTQNNAKIKRKGERVRNLARERTERHLKTVLNDPEMTEEQRAFLQAYCANCRTKKGKPLAANTQRYNAQALRALFLSLEEPKPIQQITRKEIEHFFDGLHQEGRSERVITNYRITIRAVFRWFYLKYLPTNKEDKKQYKEEFNDLFEEWAYDASALLSTPVKEEDLFTEEEFKRMMKHAGSVRNQALLMLYRESGARLEEGQNLRIQDVKIAPKTFDVSLIDSKSREERVIPIPETRRYLLAWKEVHPFSEDPNAPLWLSEHSPSNDPQPISSQRIYALIRQIMERAGIKKRIHPHLFRHKRLTELAIDEDMNPVLLKEISGHKSIKVLERVYIQSSQRKARERIYESRGIDLNAKEVKETRPPKECPSCYEMNQPKARFCSRCGSPMDLVAAMNIREAKREISFFLQTIKVLKESGALPKDTQEKLEEIINAYKKSK